jgi:autonomous glycyl radical cofactor GrcA
MQCAHLGERKSKQTFDPTTPQMSFSTQHKILSDLSTETLTEGVNAPGKYLSLSIRRAPLYLYRYDHPPFFWLKKTAMTSLKEISTLKRSHS